MASTTAANFQKNRVTVSPDVQKLYSVIQKRSGAVGGYGHDGPVYGEITMGAFQKVVNYLVEHTDFGPDSSFMDIGAGLGKPNLHAAVSPGVKLSYGVELEQLRWQLSMHNLRFCLEEANVRPTVYFENCDITSIGHFEPFTHVYMFDVGFPPDALEAIAKSFNGSQTVKALVSFTRPLHIIKTYGFEVELIGQIQTRMCGSTEGHTAYVYRSLRDPPAPKAPALETTQEVEPSSPVTDEPELPTTTPPRKKRKRTFSPSKKRRQQPLDGDFFTPDGKKAKSSPLKPRSAKDLFPEPEAGSAVAPPASAKSRSRTRADTSKPDPVVSVGISIVNTEADYLAWVSTSGRIGEPGSRPVRNAKRVLFMPS